MVQGKPELTSDSPKSFDVSPASGSPGRAISHTPKEGCWAFCLLVFLKKNLIISFNFPETHIFNRRTQRNALGAGLLGSTPLVSQRSARPSRELGLHPSVIPRLLHASCSATRPMHLKPLGGHAVISVQTSFGRFSQAPCSDGAAPHPEMQIPHFRPADDERRAGKVTYCLDNNLGTPLPHR